MPIVKNEADKDKILLACQALHSQSANHVNVSSHALVLTCVCRWSSCRS